jgi:hypothetical protein
MFLFFLLYVQIDSVIQKITSSVAKRSKFNTWCKKFGYKGPNLIAGYGIQWNIKFQSRELGYMACNVINKMIDNERDRQERDGGKNFYNNLEISRADWDVVKNFNDTLSMSLSCTSLLLSFQTAERLRIEIVFTFKQEFYFVTKKFEGDTSSASSMIGEYQTIKKFILKKKIGCEPKLKSMFEKMLEKTDTYLNEALQCDAILLATALHPSFRLSIFQKWFPTYYDYTQDLLNNLYHSHKTDCTLNTTQPTPPDHEKQPKIRHGALAEVDFFPNKVEVSLHDEVVIYLGVKYKLPTAQADNCLKWWKVSSLL